MKKYAMILALVLCLMLTACGGDRDSQGQMSLLEDAAGLSEETVLLKIDGREVPAWRYLYWLARACDTVQAQYAAAGMEVDWKAATAEGTLAEYVKNQALTDTVLYATVESWAEQYGCALAEESLRELDCREDAAMGLDQERAAELAGVGVLYSQLYTLFRTDGSPLAPDREALAVYADEQGYLTIDRILVSAGDDPDAARARAAEIFSQLNTAADQAAVFAELAAKSDDAAGARTLVPGDGTVEPALEEAAKALEVGQCSGILESEEGFSILCRLEPDAEVLAEGYFDWQLQSAAEGADVRGTENYKMLDVREFYGKLQKMREKKLTS